MVEGSVAPWVSFGITLAKALWGPLGVGDGAVWAVQAMVEWAIAPWVGLSVTLANALWGSLGVGDSGAMGSDSAIWVVKSVVGSIAPRVSISFTLAKEVWGNAAPVAGGLEAWGNNTWPVGVAGAGVA